jgi:hypothetical protein
VHQGGGDDNNNNNNNISVQESRFEKLTFAQLGKKLPVF